MGLGIFWAVWLSPAWGKVGPRPEYRALGLGLLWKTGTLASIWGCRDRVPQVPLPGAGAGEGCTAFRPGPVTGLPQAGNLTVVGQAWRGLPL